MIYLVRHGQSEWNLLRRTQGQTMHPRLTRAGREQAVAAGTAILADLDGRSVTRIVTSDLVRAVETAQLLAGALDAPVLPDGRLRERGLGTFQGLDTEQTFAAATTLDWSDPNLRVGGGESTREVSDRMVAALADADAGAGRGAVTVVVSHGDAIRTALGALAGYPPGAAPWLEVPNGAVLVLDADLPVRRLGQDAPLSWRRAGGG